MSVVWLAAYQNVTQTHGSVPIQINAHIDLPKGYRRYRKKYKLRDERKKTIRKKIRDF
jgi:hypothetical protein